ncbi:MAG TPA: RNA 2',3'-cyclic phosphodiesterase [Gammaproteobacteria bacterium]|nr:RNA 2',3'-cyclic phosphodiesterase [Gammaproteobacteria bacterium]
MRTFFAIDLSPDCKKRLSAYMHTLAENFTVHFEKDRFRWMKPQNLHLTLQFIGQLQEEDLTRLLLEVRKELLEQKAFYLKLTNLEWFPSINAPHVLSMQANEHQRLANLAKLIGKGIATCNYNVEKRPYKGHVTLARLENINNVSEEILKKFSAIELPEIFVKEIVFFRSEADMDGSRYTKLASLELLS